MDIYNFISYDKLDANLPVPLYRQIAELLADLIKQRKLAPGTKLPPERELSAKLQVSRTTAINAYRYLEKHSLVQTRVGSGTYVAEIRETEPKEQPLFWPQMMTPYTPSFTANLLKELVANTSGEGVISLAGGIPDPSLYPLELLLKADFPLDPKAFSHIPTEGYPPLRAWLAGWMNRQGIAAQPENLLVDSGSQQGLFLISRALIMPGDFVVLESPTYMGAIQVFQNAGARILPFYLESFSLPALEDAFIRYRPKLMYLNPTYQNPTGKCLTLEQRRALLQLAIDHQVLLVEDNSYGLLHFDSPPPPSLKSLDTKGIVIYLFTFSKVLFPGLRTGAIVAHEALIYRLAMEKQLIDLHSCNLAQWSLWNYLRTGALEAHLEKLRPLYKRRRDAMVTALKTYCQAYLDFEVPEGGFYIWCQLKFPFNTARLIQEGGKHGLSFVPGDAFYVQQGNRSCLRLCYVTHPEKILIEGIKRLAQVLTALSLDHGTQPEPMSHHPIV